MEPFLRLPDPMELGKLTRGADRGGARRGVGSGVLAACLIPPDPLKPERHAY